MKEISSRDTVYEFSINYGLTDVKELFHIYD